ncbi:hypothetical protein ACJRO7_017368 [Eucalyptus globulus]|uniref:Carboxypeptidase n=1 Tax=Eucalyptus globulus TaxID=34317 RepID=A0ABD3KR77_EUCGL
MVFKKIKSNPPRWLQRWWSCTLATRKARVQLPTSSFARLTYGPWEVGLCRSPRVYAVGCWLLTKYSLTLCMPYVWLKLMKLRSNICHGNLPNQLFNSTPLECNLEYGSSKIYVSIQVLDLLMFSPIPYASNDSYSVLHAWFTKFPSYRTRDFYIARESYAGKYVPELAELIHDKNKDPSLHINLKGILLGNPETSDADDWMGLVDYAWSHAVISDETHKVIRKTRDFASNNTWSNNECCEAVEELLHQYNQIDMYSLYTPTCIGDLASSDNKSYQVMMKRSSRMMPRIMGGYDPCLDKYAQAFYNRPDVQKALHVSDGHHLKNWSICNFKIFHDWKDSKPSVIPIYKKLIAAGDRKENEALGNGDTDGRVPVLSTRYSLSSLGLPITKAWRPWYHQKQVSGWYQEYEGLTFATFRGAGHAVPVFKPSDSLVFFSSFLNAQDLPSAR